jgi:amino acid transporter
MRVDRGSRFLTSSRMATEAESTSQRLTLRGAVFLGVGAMVGAGIFALLGEAGTIAGAAVWVSFLIAGLISLALGYTFVKLGARYPSSGGLITYLIQGFGNGRLVGVSSWLGYLTAIVVVGAMVAVSFGDYAARLVFGSAPDSAATKVFASLVVLASVGLVIVGVNWVDRAQSAIVIGLLVVFSVFIVATITKIHPHLLAPSGYPAWRSIISSIALTFFAFLGFAVISFAGGDIVDPKRNLPRAMYLALGITMLLYVAISVCVYGTLTVEEVVHYGPTAIAEAARPSLGDAGYVCMGIAALLATSSSVLATFYASVGLTDTLAEVKQFPPVFGRDSRLGRRGGLMITTALTLLFVNVFDIGALASIGSAVSLGVFVLVGFAGLRLRHEIGAQAWVIVAAIGASGIALAFFVVDTFNHDKRAFWGMVAIILLGVVTDVLWKQARDRRTAARVA